MAAGIYVERLVHGSLDEVWRLTQEPSVHQRWDLRFTSISYLLRIAGEPQRFLYETKLLPGLAVRGTGETLGERNAGDGSATSALGFAAETSWALIDKGSGYWKYVPVDEGVRFLTWYDYGVRFGGLGRAADLGFRPLLGWATAWSFDRLALWIEEAQTPEVSLAWAQVHAVARLAIAFVWAWHGLVPKLLLHNGDELRMLAEAGLPVSLVNGFGAAELLVAVAMLVSWERRWAFVVSAGLMAMALVGVALRSPEYVGAAFNPVTLNGLMIACSAMGWIAAGRMPLARRCLRKAAHA